MTPCFKSFIGVRQGDVLSPNIFKIFINDLPDKFLSCPDPVNINNRRVDCLMYADDVVIFSETQEGLQKRINMLHEYCLEWCFDVNLKKTKSIIFNKPGKFLKCCLHFGG